MNITVHNDGARTVEEFPEQIQVSRQLLELASPQMMRRNGDRVYFVLANGEATYLVTREMPDWLLLARIHYRLEVA